MDKLFIAIGMLAAAYFVVGILMLCMCRVLVLGGTPWSVRIKTVFVSAFVLPYMVWTHGKLPSLIIGPQDMTPEQNRQVAEFMDQCPCPNCKARRGE